MIFLCDIQKDDQSLKLAFHSCGIKYGDNFYSANYHKAQPYFQLHNHNGSEQIILKLKFISDFPFQKGKVLFHDYDKENMRAFLEADIYKTIQDQSGMTIMCNSMKAYLKRSIGRLYSDIL